MSTRKQRGKTQKIYLIECTPVSKYVKKYAVCGTSMNIYKVTIQKNPICTCPDHQTRHRRCKHIYFILLRVMKVKPKMEDVKEYTKKNLTSMFQNIPLITNNLIVQNNIINKYNRYKKAGKLSNSDDADKYKVKDMRDQEMCPICLDPIDNGEKVDYCKYSCGNPIHVTCFTMWTQRFPKNCVYCKANWDKDKNELKYVNLMS